jgi:hypothetical protein
MKNQNKALIDKTTRAFVFQKKRIAKMKTLSEFLDNTEVEHMFEAVSKLKFAKLPNWNKFKEWG